MLSKLASSRVAVPVVVALCLIVVFAFRSQFVSEAIDSPAPPVPMLNSSKGIALHGGFGIPARSLKSELTGSPRVAAAADFNADGVGDLVVAHKNALALHTGDINAFAPQTEAAWEAIRDGRFVSPFSAKVQTLPVPVSADFVQTGDFNRDTHLDIAFAARGGDTFVRRPVADASGGQNRLRRQPRIRCGRCHRFGFRPGGDIARRTRERRPQIFFGQSC